MGGYSAAEVTDSGSFDTQNETTFSDAADSLSVWLVGEPARAWPRATPRYPARPCTALRGPARPCTALHGAAPHHATTTTAPRRAASLSLCVAPRLCGERAACSPACSTAGLGVHSQGISRGERCVDAAQALPEGLEAPEIRDAIKVRAWCMHGRGVHELCA